MIFLVLLVATVATARGQETVGEKFEIASIRFQENETFGDGELLEQMTTTETPGFFGKFLHSISEGLGSENQYFDQATFGEDVGRIRRLYEDNGFSNAQIDTVLTFSPHDQTVDILVTLKECYRSVIDSIQYAGLRGVGGEVWVGIGDSPRITKGDPFRKALVEEEIRRVSDILLNEGYPNSSFVRDSSGAFRVLSTGNYVIVLHFKPGKRFVFGDVVVEQKPDSLRRDEIHDEIVLKQLDYEPGDKFSEAKRRSSERNLNRVGVFDQARIAVDVPPDTGTSNRVTSLVTLRPSDKHELAPELTVSDEDKAFNLGPGLVYTQRNFLGGARTFTARIRFRTQTILSFPDYFETNSDAVSNLDLSVEVLQPYVFTNKIRGSWTFSLILDKQQLYRQEILKNTIGFAARMGVYSQGYLDWTLQSVRLRRNTLIAVDLSDPEIQEQYYQLLAQEQEVQFNSILSFTTQRDKSNDIFSPTQGFAHSATVEESGLLPLILKSAQPDLPFTQFYRMVLLGRWYFDQSQDEFAILALKLKAGFEDKYGETRSDTTRVIPQTHRFYAGGGGSIRGWNSRELSASGVPQLGGNLALEGSAELRTNLFRGFRNDVLDHVWIVTFLDVGNVWREASDLRLSSLAVATGIGFRYDSFFGPFRIDFGLRVYDPSVADPGRRWITQRKFFSETLGQGALHFGIGHAF